MKIILKSPILHFVIVGVIAYLLYIVFKPVNTETIYITTQTIDALIQQQKSITQNPITEEEKENLIAGYIEDEILLREAYKRGINENVFRSFDIRDESEIYDRLSVSVIGDQLSQIYLESRRLLELENRGGARARIDEVEILDINSIETTKEGGLKINTTWKVSGSVNHYGHTHYRQNVSNAIIHISSVESVWKIRNIEIIDEQRIL